MTMTHKDAIGVALDAYHKRVLLSGAIEDAIRAYIDARGLVMVPREPNADMLAEGMEFYAVFDDSEAEVDAVYRAMLSAAPDPFEE